MKLAIGVAVGTTSTKGVLVDPVHNGQILATARRNHEMTMPQHGWAEMDADAVWYPEVIDILRELAPAASEHDGEIAGICISGMGPCVVQADLIKQRTAQKAVVTVTEALR